MHKNHGLKSMFDVCPEISGWAASVVIPTDFLSRSVPGAWILRCSSFLASQISLFGYVDELISEQPLRPPLVIFLPLRSSRLYRLGYLSIVIHHDFHFIALLRSSTVDDIYVVGHAVSDSCLLLSFASLNYLKIFNF